MRKLGRKPGEKLLLFRGCLSTVSGRNTPTRFQRILVTRTNKEMLPKKSHSYHRDTNETRPCDTFYWPVVVSPRDTRTKDASFGLLVRLEQTKKRNENKERKRKEGGNGGKIEEKEKGQEKKVGPTQLCFSACAENVDELEPRGARYPVICLSTNHFQRPTGTTIFVQRINYYIHAQSGD